MLRFLAALLLCLVAISSADARTRHDGGGVFDRHAVHTIGSEAVLTERAIRRKVRTVGQTRTAGLKQIIRKHKLKQKKHRKQAPPMIAKAVPAEQAPLVAKARAYIGQSAAQIGVRRNLWCSAFLRFITKATGVNDLAKSWLVKERVQPSVGAIAVLHRGRRGGGHVGVVSGFDKRGNPILISGNHRNRVAEARYPKHRVIAYVRGV